MSISTEITKDDICRTLEFSDVKGLLEGKLNNVSVSHLDPSQLYVGGALNNGQMVNYGQPIGGYHNMFSQMADSSMSTTYELKLLDGTKIVKDILYHNIKHLSELKLVTYKTVFTWKFPFKTKEQISDKRFTRLVYKENDNTLTTLDIDCNLSMFMKILGKDYKSWSKTLMSESVKYGAETN